MTRNNILEKQKLDGKYIPIVPILGQQVILDGEKAYISLVRFAKDPQKIYNYMHTAYVETMSQAPKAPFLVAAESDVTKYDEWKSLNTKSHAYLRYRATDDMGNPLPAPIRMQPPDASQAAVMGLQISDNNLRDVTGIAQAQLGQQSNEVSGVAIDARTEEGDENIYHFLANNNNALLYLAHILVDLIPYVYDVPRAIRILGEDMVQKIVWINQEDGNSKNPDGKLYNVTVGKYDVVMDTGPRFETRRLETANAMFKLINSVPQFGQVTADQLIGMLDFPQAEQVAQRYRAFINQTYPNLIPVDDNGLLSTPDQLKAMLQQAQGVITQNAQQAQAIDYCKAINDPLNW